MSTARQFSDRSGGLVESYKGYDPRVIFFYFIIAGLLVVLAGGLAYRQLLRADDYERREKYQNQRRVVTPGPRGNIYARDGQTILVGNRPRFSVILFLDELKTELRREQIRIHDNFLRAEPKEVPTYAQLEQIARVSVVQRYLDQVNRILGRDSKVDAKALRTHFDLRLHLPFTLLDNLDPEEYARLLEKLPVRSALQVYTSSRRYYPYGALAAHTLGYVREDDNIDATDLPGGDVRTLPAKGYVGKDGLEKSFDATLQGQAGTTVFRVDPAGFRIDPPLEKVRPVQGNNLVTSLDVDLQLAAEEAIGDQVGAAVALDVNTGEVLVMASKPNYDLNQFSPRATTEIVAQMNETGAWRNLAVNGFYPPGSTFKILTSIAGLRSGALRPDDSIIDCDGVMHIGTRPFYCYNGLGHHHHVLLPEAITQSCDIYFYEAGRLITPDRLAEEARRFHLDQRTGIELPSEEARMIIPTPAWKERLRDEKWFPGDTANMSIGQGDVLLSPLLMACFTASVARGETVTKPTLIHDPARPPQRSEPIGLSTAQRAALLEGMVGVTTTGTAKILTQVATLRVPGVTIAGKTGTAQKDVQKNGRKGKINYAWFICFAPVENPRIAMAIVLEGEELGEEFGGGRNSGPVASAILKKYFEKKNRPMGLMLKPLGGQ